MNVSISLDHLGLLLHLMVELPACINFFLRPSATLSKSQPYSHCLIRQYALLLVSTNLIALAFLMRPADHLSGQISGALVVYHIGPLVRAMSRIRTQDIGRALGGPWLHLFAHLLCVVALVICQALIVQ